MAHAVRPPYSGVGQRTDLPVTESRQEVPSHRWLSVSVKCLEHGGTRRLYAARRSFRPVASRTVLPVIGVSGFFITTGPRHIQIPPQMPRRDSEQKAILPATREIYVARTTSSRKLRKTNRTRNSSGGRQAGKRCAGCDRTGSLEICEARMVRATAQPADTRDLSRTATT
jgi:hypothetical protein